MNIQACEIEVANRLKEKKNSLHTTDAKNLTDLEKVKLLFSNSVFSCKNECDGNGCPGGMWTLNGTV